MLSTTAPLSQNDRTNVPCDKSLGMRRLRRNLSTLVNAHPHFEALGDHEHIAKLAMASGIDLDQLAILRVRVRGKRYCTLVAVLSRLWNAASGKAALLRLKRAADRDGYACILIPESAVQRQPRLGTAQTIEDAMGVRVTAEDRLAVLAHLIDVGYSTLLDCAARVKGDAPVSVVLSLVAEGAVRMGGTHLHPETRIDLPAAGFWAA